MSYTESFDDASEDTRTGFQKFVDNPAAGIGCGCIWPVLAFLSAMAAKSSSMNLAMAAGSIIGGMILVWLPFLIFWRRKAPIWVLIVSAILAFIALATVQLGKFGQQLADTKRDAQAVSQLKLDENGEMVLPEAGADAGPMTKLTLLWARKQKAISDRFAADFDALDQPTMADAAKLSKRMGLLSHCNDFLTLRTKSENYRAESKAVVMGMDADIDAMEASEELRRELHRATAANQARNLAMIDRQWDAQASIFQPMYTQCTVLAHRRWQAKANMFMFTTDADLRQFNAAAAQIDAANARIVAVNKERIGQVTAAQDHLKQQLNGSGSQASPPAPPINSPPHQTPPPIPPRRPTPRQ